MLSPALLRLLPSAHQRLLLLPPALGTTAVVGVVAQPQSQQVRFKKVVARRTRPNLVDKFLGPNSKTKKKQIAKTYEVWPTMSTRDLARAIGGVKTEHDLFDFVLSFPSARHLEDETSPIGDVDILNQIAKKMKLKFK